MTGLSFRPFISSWGVGPGHLPQLYLSFPPIKQGTMSITYFLGVSLDDPTGWWLMPGDASLLL